MDMSKAKLHAYSMAEVDEGIIAIRSFELKGRKDVVGFLLVNRMTSPTPKKDGFLMVLFNEGLQPEDTKKAVIDITPKEYNAVIQGKRNLPEGVTLKDILFDGTLIFEDISLMVNSIKDWGYGVEINDDPMKRLIGFKCKSGRAWSIKFTDLKKSINEKKNSKILKLFENKDQLLMYLNNKPVYKN